MSLSNQYRVFFFCILILPFTNGFGQDKIFIDKPGKTGNPTLSLKHFENGGEARNLLENGLRSSDWFNLDESDQAEYHLYGSFKKLPSTYRIGIKVVDQSGNPVTLFEMNTSTETSLKVFIYSVVDEMISQIFKVPGFCSSSLAFVKEIDGIKEIWISDFDGGNPKQITHNNYISVEPDWGRDQEVLIYTFYNKFSTDLMLYDLRRQRQKPLTGFPGLNASGAISNRGDKAAMVLSKDGHVDLYTMNLKNGRLAKLTNNLSAEASPCWSPNDDKICFVSDGIAKRPTIFVIPTQGGTPKRLLKIPVEVVSPDWSKVSNKICFAIRSGRKYTIAYIDMNSNSIQPETLLAAEGDWESPSWASDGRHIVCSRTLNGKRSLYLLDSYFKKVIPLKNYTGNDSLPSYSNNHK